MTNYEAANALIDHQKVFSHDFGWNTTVLDALDVAIKTLQDVRPVVNCGECKHWFDNGTDLCSCDRDALLRRRDFFCADGARKDGAEDV